MTNPCNISNFVNVNIATQISYIKKQWMIRELIISITN